MFRKNIFTAASPNTQFDDMLLAKFLIWTPWNWYRKKYDESFKNMLRNYLGIEHITLIDSWRSGFYIFLKSIEIKNGDEVIIPSFTCVVVANATRWSGATPVYLDSNEDDFNGEYENIFKYINPNTKVILVQHTFGKIVDVYALKERLAKIKREDIIIVEDFAHTISRNLELKGDVGIFTFGIEKVISSVRGGAITTNVAALHQKVEEEVANLPRFPRKQLIKSLLNPIFWFIDIPLHSVGFKRFTIGAVIRNMWRKMGFLGIMVDPLENKAMRPDWFPAQMAPALSRLGSKQLGKLDKFNKHRTNIAKIYHEKLSEYSDEKIFDEKRVYLRYPLLLKSEEEFVDCWNICRNLGLTAGNWFATPLYGSAVSQETYDKLCYSPQNTPETLKKTGMTLNLPTSVNMPEKRAREISNALVRYLENGE